MGAHRSAVVGLLLLAATGCRSDEATTTNTRAFGERSVSDGVGLPPETDTPVTHGSISRAHTQRLDGELQAILKVTLPSITSLLTDLDAVVAKVKPAPHLATTDPVLKTWHQADRDAYQTTIDGLYAEAEKRVKALADAALAEGLARARDRAPEPSPLDAGATGEAAIDGALETFNEVVEGATRLQDIEDRHGHDRRQRVDLFEAFSTFGSSAAETTMGGRILLFVGGDETTGAPASLLAFRCDEGVDPKSRSFVQVFRHRIMRGGTVVKDLGWRLAPQAGGSTGHLHTETLENFLLAPDAQPVVDTQAPAFDQLRDMRIVVDIQSALFDVGGKALGGVDWRIEFQVSARGDVTWQLAGGKPVFDPYCTEVTRLLQPQSAASASAP